ncbi:hypothetical protein ASB57_19565 [Bordetella sp. N]|nr:hypothetical protein ASB57_19565 [Bordetella sp. N]
MARKLGFTLLLSVLAGGTLVIACGPDFPAQLLDDRGTALNATPTNSFAYEVSHLVSTKDKFHVQEDDYYDPARDRIPDDADKALSADLKGRLKAMRRSADGDAAYAAGDGLQAALRLYTAGAVDYRLAQTGGDEASKDPAKDPNVVARRAGGRFKKVLDLPVQEGAPRAVWAAYMLAELQAQGYVEPVSGQSVAGAYGPPGVAREPAAGAPGDAAAPAADADADPRSPSGHVLTERAAENAWREDVARAYERVRALARTGADDSQGLAVASYGQQALLYLAGPDGTCGYADISNQAPCADDLAPAALKHAIHLYAEQAAQGSNSGLQSLSTLADWALSSPDRVRSLIDDSVARRLLVAYALARLGDIVDGKPDSANDVFAVDDINGQHGLADAGVGNKRITPNPMLTALTQALATLDLDGRDGADRVAALAYRVGRYDLAGTLANRLQTPLAWWVRAKLATRQGDTAAAAQAYAQAVQALQRDDSLETSARARLSGERGVLSLARGQYVEALNQLYQASTMAQPGTPLEDAPLMGQYWNDLAYVAERVLTTEELRNYVDTHVPASPVPAVDLSKMDATAQSDWLYQHPVTVADRLRQLLARRLMRDGARKQALAYFPPDSDARFMSVNWADNQLVVTPRLARQAATDYDTALSDAHGAWRDVTRAQALYRAAGIARKQGMDLLAYEQDPDFAVYDGGYTYGAGRDTRELAGPYITDDERQRYAATEAKPYARFHYREIAADHAVAAAAALPARSQAYAATLCSAARYIIDDDPKRASAIYMQYIKNGAAVPFAASFGRACPAPDFEAAARFPYVQAWRKVKRHPAEAASAAVAALALVAAAVTLLRRRRIRTIARNKQQ